MTNRRLAVGLTGALIAGAFILATALDGAASRDVSPVYWVENAGQFDEHVLFRSEGAQETVWLLEDEIWVTYLEPGGTSAGLSGPGIPHSRTPARVQNIRILFAGNENLSAIVTDKPVDFLRSFLTPAGNFTHVPLWGEVFYPAIGPGLALRLSAGEEGIVFGLEADRPGTQLELAIEGSDGLEIVDDQLVVRTAFGERALPFQADRFPVTIAASGPSGAPAELEIGQGAAPDAAARARTPATGEVAWGTYYGVAGLSEFGSEIVADPDGNAYVAGNSEMPVTAPGAPGLQVPEHLVSAFILKLDPDGAGAEYLTTIAGMLLGDEDYALDIAIDSERNVYVTGLTSSEDFPTTPGAFDETHNGGLNDAWLAKLDPAGGVEFSTLVGSGGNDWANGVGLGVFGEIYITGFTSGPGFPTTSGSFDPSHNGGFDAFVASFSNDGSTLVAGTFLGGSGNEGGDFSLDRSDIAVDSVGSAVITGPTASANYPVTGPVIGPGGCKDIFITKLSPELTGVYYSARIGGSGTSCGFNGDDSPERLAVDAGGRVFVAGYTSTAQGQGFPVTPGAFDMTYGGSYDAFLIGFDPGDFEVAYGTYLGAASIDVGKDVAIDLAGRLVVTGYTFSAGFPTGGGPFDGTLSGDSDAFILQLEPLLTGAGDLVYGTFFGGSARDWGVGIEVFGEDILFLTGLSASADFPTTTGSYQEDNSGDQDAYIARFHLLDPQPPPGPAPTWTPAPYEIQAPAVFHDNR